MSVRLGISLADLGCTGHKKSARPRVLELAPRACPRAPALSRPKSPGREGKMPWASTARRACLDGCRPRRMNPTRRKSLLHGFPPPHRLVSAHEAFSFPSRRGSKSSSPGSAAAVLVTGGVIYVLNTYENMQQPKPERHIAASDAGAGAAAAAGSARRRAGPRPRRQRAGAHSLAGLEGHPRAHLSGEHERPAAPARRQRGVLLACVALFPAIAAGVSSYALFADAEHDRQASRDRRPTSFRQGALDLLQGEISPHRQQERRPAHLRLPDRARHRAVERECRNEGDLRRAQHHL